MSLVSLQNLSKKYGVGENEFYALNNVSLYIEKSELIAITGASGSGKSTLLNIIGGLDFPSNGNVFYNDNDLYSMNDKELSEFRLKKIGFVFQFFNLIPELTAYENIILPLNIDNKKPKEADIREITDMLDISNRLQHIPAQMSGGQQQRTAIARALINNPEILLCDEPTGNLDAKMGNEVISFLIKINKVLQKTIVIVTHDIGIANQCNRIIEISDGVIISDIKNN